MTVDERVGEGGADTGRAEVEPPANEVTESSAIETTLTLPPAVIVLPLAM